ncbi:MAG: hypothetical protein K5905_06970 [Roseibium sp.]|uniref:xylulokinase n=1 Tax=Roseibium sp. TaxID=1936156 RepID=UPI002628CCB2|nr:FGGY family carbohydrate kinase [Roseibium sp.]MCV0425196.1 hypothetical protein [Roseibium sp.]
MSFRRGGAVFVGVDIGTSSVKAVMADERGVRLANYASSYGTNRSVAGAAEQFPADWIRHVEKALKLFADHARAGDIVAIGITSQVNTHVFCDQAGMPLCPAVTWQDTRPAKAAARLEALIDVETKIRALGAPIPIDASHALARMAWMAEEHPETWAATRHVMLPKDYVIAQLTGDLSADPISAVGLVGENFDYANDVLDLVPRAVELLPRLADPLEIAGTVRDGWPFEGIPVAVGTMDAWASMFGLGVVSEGQGMYLSGTSEVLGLISRTRTGKEGVIVFPEWRGITLHAGPTQSGGATLEWLSRLLGKDVASLSAEATATKVTAKSPLFLPHLSGERAPLWDAASRGAFSGLTGATGPEAFVIAAMEGVAFSARLALEAVEASGARSLASVRHGGGGAMSDTWCQIRANALGKTMERVSGHEPGATGALVIAGVACGAIENLEAAAQSLVSVEREFLPGKADVEVANERFEAFQTLYRSLKPLND